MNMPEPSALSLLPVLVTLIVALSVRNVLVGLFSGVITGVAMLVIDSLFLERSHGKTSGIGENGVSE